jgi:hypothetical protein
MDEAAFKRELQRLRALLPAHAASVNRREPQTPPDTTRSESHLAAEAMLRSTPAEVLDDAVHRLQWRKTLPDSALFLCNELRLIANMAIGQKCRMECARRRVNLLAPGQVVPRVWLLPKPKHVLVAVCVEEPIEWLGRLRAQGMRAYQLEGDLGVQTSVNVTNINRRAMIVGELISDGILDPEG